MNEDTKELIVRIFKIIVAVLGVLISAIQGVEAYAGNRRK